jgi:hypothetical protein
MITDEFDNELQIGDFACVALTSPHVKGYVADVREGGLSLAQSLIPGGASANQVSETPGFITLAIQIPVPPGLRGRIPGVTKGYGPKTAQPEV